MKGTLRHSRKWSAILIGLTITVLLSLLIMGFFDVVLRAGKNVKAIEQSTQAYYLATGIAENQLRANNKLKKEPWKTEESIPTDDKAYSWSKLLVTAKSPTVPAPGLWNSPFDSNYNLISLDKPVQIVIPDGIDWNNVKFSFRIPKASNNEIAAHPWSDGIILWTFWNKDKVLFANTLGLFSTNEILSSTSTDEWKIIGWKGWYYYLNNTTNPTDFSSFYDNQMQGVSWNACANFGCTLKLSMLHSVRWNNWQDYPFLEYKIDFGYSVELPSQYMVLDSKGKVGNYIRTRKIFIPQITTNTALDFAVLQ